MQPARLSGGQLALFLMAGIGAVTMITGATGPWVTVFGSDVSGMRSSGPVVLVAALLTLGTLAVGLGGRAVVRGLAWPFALAAVFGAVGVAVTGYELIDLYLAARAGAGRIFGFQVAGLGWGLVVALVGSVVVLGAGGLAVYASRPRRTGAPGARRL